MRGGKCTGNDGRGLWSSIHANTSNGQRFRGEEREPTRMDQDLLSEEDRFSVRRIQRHHRNSKAPMPKAATPCPRM